MKRSKKTMEKNNNIKICILFIFVLEILIFTSCKNNIVNAEQNNGTENFPVKVTNIEKRIFTKTVEAQGTIDTKEHAIVSARIDGVVTDLFVDKGDEVIANKTPLFQIDKVRVEQAYEIAKQDLAVAKCGIREAEANLANMKAQYEKAKTDYERFQRLIEKKAISKDTWELQETRYKATKAGLEHAEAVCQLANEQLKKAEHALKISEKTLSDSLVYAPISGKVSYKFVEQNEFIGAGRPILKIDNPEVLEASIFLPAEYYPYIDIDKTEAVFTAMKKEIGTFKITYKSPTILPNLRTFEVKAILNNKDDYIVAGAMVEVSVILEKKEALGIPKECVLTAGNEKFIFTVFNNVAQKVPVTIGLEINGWVELVDTTLQEGTPIISMGQSFIKEGQKVQVMEDNTK